MDYVFGTATIPAGLTVVTVLHGLPSTPTVDQITLITSDDLGGRTLYPSNPTATTFDINLSFMDLTAYTVNWIIPSNTIAYMFGSVKIPKGYVSASVIHSLPFTPTVDSIKLTAQDDLGGQSLFASSPTSTTFQLNITSMDPFTDHTINWLISKIAPIPSNATLDGRPLTITRWMEDASVQASQWDSWTNSAYKRRIKVYGIVRTYTIDCIEQNILWPLSQTNYFEAVADAGAPVIFYSAQTVRPVDNANVYVLHVSWTIENIGGQNIRKFTLTLQEV